MKYYFVSYSHSGPAQNGFGHVHIGMESNIPNPHRMAKLIQGNHPGGTVVVIINYIEVTKETFDACNERDSDDQETEDKELPGTHEGVEL